jgi:hypothetical protein
MRARRAMVDAQWAALAELQASRQIARDAGDRV